MKKVKVINTISLQCSICKEYSARFSRAEIKKSKPFGDNTIFFYFTCSECGAPMYLHQDFGTSYEGEALEISKDVTVDLVNGVPPYEVEYRTIKALGVSAT